MLAGGFDALAVDLCRGTRRAPSQSSRVAPPRSLSRGQGFDAAPVDGAAVQAVGVGHLPQVAGLAAVLLPVAVHAEPADDLEVHLGDGRVGVELAVGAEAGHAPELPRARAVGEVQRFDLVESAAGVLADAEDAVLVARPGRQGCGRR